MARSSVAIPKSTAYVGAAIMVAFGGYVVKDTAQGLATAPARVTKLEETIDRFAKSMESFGAQMAKLNEERIAKEERARIQAKADAIAAEDKRREFWREENETRERRMMEQMQLMFQAQRGDAVTPRPAR